MRISILAEATTRTGGSGSHVSTSARALADAGNEVLVIADEADGASVALPGLARSTTTPAVRERLFELVRAHRADVVHVHDLQDAELVERLAGGWPTVISVHSHATCPTGFRYFRSGEPCTRNAGLGCFGNMLVRGCAHRVDPIAAIGGYRTAQSWLAMVRRAHRVVVYSRHMAAQQARDAETPIDVVPLLVDDVVVGAEVQRRPRTILFVGRLVANKGPDVLLEALKGLDADLEIVGDGWLRSELERTASAPGLAGRVTFRGWLSGRELAAAYASATVVCVPSLWPEPFGLVGIEAMANACPVVGSAVGGITEWLDDHRTGLAVSAGDPDALRAALDLVLRSPQLATEMGAAGKVAVGGRFTAADHVTALERSYAATIATARKDPV